MRRPWLCAAILSAFACLLGTALPAVGIASAATALALTRTVTVSSNGTAYTEVVLPRAVQAPERARRLVQEWKGNATAVLLVPDRPDVLNRNRPPPALVVPDLPGREVNQHPYVFIGIDPPHNEPAIFYNRMPAGRYRLYVISSGPAEVTLQLPGLARGRTRVIAKTPGRAMAVGTHRQASTVPLPPTFSYGDAGRLSSSRALVWSFIWMDSPVRVADAAGSCLYYPPPRSPAVYSVPSCATATGGNLVPDLSREYIGYVPSPNFWMESESYVRAPSGRLTVGAHIFAHIGGPVVAEGAEILWLSW